MRTTSSVLPFFHGGRKLNPCHRFPKDAMSTYRWSCLACGVGNAEASSLCAGCGCPARATLAQLRIHRQKFQEEGGGVGESVPALQEEHSFQASRLALAVIWAITFGYVPQRFR